MKFLAVLLLVLIVFTSKSQSVYLLKYKPLTGSDTSTINAFFVLKDNGSGFVRIKYKNATTEVLKEMELQEQYNMIAGASSTGNDSLFYETLKPRVVLGADNGNAEQPIFWFSKNNASGEFEPAGIGNKVGLSRISYQPFSSIQVLDSAGLKEDLVLEYFTKTDNFYRNLFRIKARALLPAEKSIRLHLLVVANTNDTSIGLSCEKDMSRAVETFTNIANVLGINMVSKTISGPTYTKANVERELKALTPAPNDIVIFYYSGHGFRKDDVNSLYPFIDLRAKPKDNYLVQSLNIEDIYRSIKGKGARLSLVLSDCCNNNPNDTNVKGTPMPRTKGFPIGLSRTNCQELFLNPKPLSLLASSADIGQKAHSTDDFGGYFSYFFKKALDNQCGVFNLAPSWKKVFEEAKKQTVYKARRTYCSRPFIPQNRCSDQFPIWQ